MTELIKISIFFYVKIFSWAKSNYYCFMIWSSGSQRTKGRSWVSWVCCSFLIWMVDTSYVWCIIRIRQGSAPASGLFDIWRCNIHLTMICEKTHRHTPLLPHPPFWPLATRLWPLYPLNTKNFVLHIGRISIKIKIFPNKSRLQN